MMSFELLSPGLLLAFGATVAVGSVSIAWYICHKHFSDMTNLTRKTPPGFPAKTSRELPGEDGARVCTSLKEGEPLLKTIDPSCRTIYEVMHLGRRKAGGSAPCLGYRPGKKEPYKWITWDEVIDQLHSFGKGLVAIGTKPGQETNVGIFSQNRPEYTISEHAVYSQSMVLVPLYETLGLEAIEHIVRHCVIQLVLLDNIQKVETLFKLRDKLPSVSTIVCFDTITPEIQQTAKDLGYALHSFKEVVELGRSKDSDFHLPSPSDVALLSFTSGTTGVPKGVITTHENVIAVSSSVFSLLKHRNLEMGKNDVYISYLPLAHSFERAAATSVTMAGGVIGYFGGSILGLTDDIKCLRPTVFCTVPRLLNRIHDKVMAGISKSYIKKTLFNLAYNAKLKSLCDGTFRRGDLWDRLVFKKIQSTLGGRLRFVVCGSAPLSPDIIDFSRVAFGIPVIEGYGQTENAAGACIQLPGENKAGNVGPPLDCCKVKLVDIPEMNYFAKNDKGEVCLKGYNVSVGYYKMPDKTAEVLDEDGWLHTGDVGAWDESGNLKIIDRKKNIFKLAQGEYVAPEKVENIYVTAAPVAQVFVHGNSYKASLVGIVMPDAECFLDWCKSKELKVNGANMAQLCKREDVRAAVLKEITDVGKAGGLCGFEQVKSIYLHPELLTVEMGLLTPTMKAKRVNIVEHFKREIDTMYETLA